MPQPSTIRRARTVIKSVLWFVANGALVAEIWPFQVLQGSGRTDTEFTRGLLVVYMIWFTHGLHALLVHVIDTMSKPCAYLNACLACPKGREYHDVPSVYGAGYAKSDSTT